MILTGGQRYDVKMEFYDHFGGAVARLSWLRPGQSSYAIIPQAQLYPLMGGPILFVDSFDSGLGNWSAMSGDWGNYGSYEGRTQLNASVPGITGTFVYSPALTTVLGLRRMQHTIV
jgi:hypothetical protein